MTGCDRRRSYYLSIATCYCTPQAVREFIDAVRAKVKLLVKIYLYVDRRTAISIGRAELSELERAYPDLLKVYAVRTARLFHTKGFCLAAYDADDEPVHGRLAIGSANLTNPGLTAMHGNVESLAVHSDISTISEFLEFFENEDVDGNLLTIDQLTDFSPYDTTDFQYALLTRGLFSHKWSASLAAYFSVRYRLNDVGRQQAAAGVDVAGFQVEAATISKSYFVDFDPQAWRPNDRNLVLNFGIECFLGHWIPKSVFESNEDNKEPFNQFKSALFEELELAMDAKCREILEDYDELRHVGIIVSVR
ncbi:MAG: phospholipase D-like domain-containing protein [Rhodobacteraceae bacterium]|nr:phospholipase D-like domain-containing protein [Paracoccaceae bacterium]